MIMALAVAATALSLSACNKDSGEKTNEGKVGLSIMLGGNSGNMRSIEAPGVNQTVATVGEREQDLYAYVYVVGSTGEATVYDLIPSEAQSSEGQFIGEVNLNSTVYVVANVPAAQKDVFAALSTLRDVKAAETLITTQRDYTHVGLSNRDGVEKVITDDDGDGEALVLVNLSPVISRLELVSVRGVKVENEDSPNDGKEITSFDVEGVYVDKFYRSFNWAGQGINIYQMGVAPNYTEVLDWGMGDEVSTRSGVNATAAPASGNVWAYNVASGGLPMLIVKVKNVLIDNSTATEVTLASGAKVTAYTQTFYLTVTGYTGMSETTFQRGKIYRVGGLDFNMDDLAHLTPNPTDVNLKVQIEVDPWEVKEIGTKL